MAKKRESEPSAPKGFSHFVRLRPRVWASLLVLASCSFIGNQVWKRYAPVIARHPQYRLDPQDIHITPPPAWLQADIKAEVLSSSGLAASLSVLDDWPTLCQRVSEAFQFHPWVASVVTIQRRLPSALEVELAYRQPVAAVESTDEGSIDFLPIDIQAIRLPAKDLSEIDIRYLPRITSIGGRPLVGDIWKDERVTEGVKLAGALGDVWQQLRLVEIIPSPRPTSRGEIRFHTFEITTSGGTRILWGVAPGREPMASESPFEVKRQRLLNFAAHNGTFRSIDGPELVDVRNELVVTPRSARRRDASEETTTK